MFVDSIYVLQLYHALPPKKRSEMLKRLCEMVVDSAIPHSKWESEIDQDFSADHNVYNEIAERMTAVHSDSYAAEVISNNIENFDLEDGIFPDGRAEAVLVSDAEVTLAAKTIYDVHQEAGSNIHSAAWIDPSDFSGPRGIDDEDEYNRQVRDFSDLVRDWRHGLITGLICDANYFSALLEKKRKNTFKKKDI